MITRVGLTFSLILCMLPMGCADSTGSNSEDTAEETSEETGPGTVGDNEWILGANCGDGECTAKSENAINCSADCGTSEAATCVEANCSLSLDACLSTNECTEVVGCLLACETSECGDACLEGADDTTAFIAGDVLTCAQDSCSESLFESLIAEEGGEEEEGEEEGEEDGVFPEGGEGGEINAEELFECVEAECPGEVSTCLEDPVCAGILDCIQNCPSDDSGCLQDCALSGGFNGAAIGLITCASGTDCLEGAGGGPGGGGPGGGPGGGDDGGEEEGEEDGNEEEGGDWDTCGNGECDQFEEFWCPEDCEGEGGEEGEEEEGGDWDTCGNDKCDDFEEFWCPEDCEDKEEGGEDGKEEGEEDGKEEGGEGPWGEEGGDEDGEEEGMPEAMEDKLECIVDNCDVGMCLNNQACSWSLICMAACNSSDCLQDCADSGGPGGGPMQSILASAVDCTEDAGCLEYESDNPEDCIFVYCGDAVASCMMDPACGQQIDCHDLCDQKPAQFQDDCHQECSANGMNSNLQDLYFCGEDNNCND